MRIYVASSWRNAYQPVVVAAVRAAGHEVYDFRQPAPGNDGFRWAEIDPGWESWGPVEMRAALENPIADSGFRLDFRGMTRADAGVLVLPSGRSAHLEAGWLAACSKPVLVFMPEPSEPELMYRLLDGICVSMDEVIDELAAIEEDRLAMREALFGESVGWGRRIR